MTDRSIDIADMIFAVANTVSAKAKYLTAGKGYEVLREHGEIGFEIIDDTGNARICLWKGCAHLDDGDWTRVTEWQGDLTAEEQSMIDLAWDRHVAAGPQCEIPPEGWTCIRGAGHEGPCAAIAKATSPGGEQ